MHPIFAGLGVFPPFLRKMVENALKFSTFGCFLTIFFFFLNSPTDPNILKFHWGQHNNFLFLALA